MFIYIRNFQSRPLTRLKVSAILTALLISGLSPSLTSAQEEKVDHFFDGQLANKYWKQGLELEKNGNYLKAIEEYSKMGQVAIDGGKESVIAVSTVNDLIGKFLAIEARSFSVGDAKTAVEASRQRLKLIEYKEGKNSQAYKTAALNLSRYESSK